MTWRTPVHNTPCLRYWERDRYDDIAPCTQSVEQQDEAEGDKDLHPDFNESYNLSDDLGIPSVDNTEPLILNELQDDEYRSIVQTLNREQKEFFYHVTFDKNIR